MRKCNIIKFHFYEIFYWMCTIFVYKKVDDFKTQKKEIQPGSTILNKVCLIVEINMASLHSRVAVARVSDANNRSPNLFKFCDMQQEKQAGV